MFAFRSVDSERGLLASAVAEYPLHRKREDPDHATQSHDDHMSALAAATRQAVGEAGITGDKVQAIALDTTGSSVIPVGEGMAAARRILPLVRPSRQERSRRNHRSRTPEELQAIDWCGGMYSSEWGFSKLLHWLRHNPEKRDKFVSAFEHCDMVAATLCGITDPKKVKRSVCAMGHKWMWNAALGGLPAEDFLIKVDPLLEGVRGKLDGRYRDLRPDRRKIVPGVGGETGASSGHPDSSWRFRRALGRDRRGVRRKATWSTWSARRLASLPIAAQAELVPGVCGVVKGSVHPGYAGIEAGLSADRRYLQRDRATGRTRPLPN